MRCDGYSICLGELEQALYGASSAVLNERQQPIAIIASGVRSTVSLASASRRSAARRCEQPPRSASCSSDRRRLEPRAEQGGL